MKKYSITFFVFVSLILSGCGVLGTPAPTPDKLATIVAATLTSIPPASSTPEAATSEPFMLTPTPSLVTSTPEAAGTRYVYTSAQNVNLRIGPGRLFQVSRVLAQGTRLELLGIAPGDKWVEVKSDEGITGWVDGQLVAGDFDGLQPPVVNPENVVTITGIVSNDNGPITYLGIAIVQGDQFDEGYTDTTGQYYIYLPKTLKGEWTLQQYAVDCRSNTMDANCHCVGGTCGTLNPSNYRLTFPLSNTFYRFGWQ